MNDYLAFERKTRKGAVDPKGEPHKNERHYIDFVVSGKSLAEVFETIELDLIGNFGWTTNRKYEREQISEFVLDREPALATNRSMFYVCAECGDIGCGAITARITERGNQIIWSDFAYEDGAEDYDLSEYEDVGPFVFEKTQYRAKFSELESTRAK